MINAPEINNQNSSPELARFTLIESVRPSTLTKIISLTDDGSLVKQPSAHLIEGSVQVKEIANIQDFAQLISGLQKSQALVYGVPNEGLVSAKVVTKKRFEKLGDTQGIITRSNQHFNWPQGAGVMMFDYDPDDEALDKNAVLELLYEVCPTLKEVDHVWWMSSSSNICNTKTDEKISEVAGQRIYVMVADAEDIPRAAQVIEQRLWLAGHGYFKVSASGAMLERVTFDMSVYQPSRLDFAAGASCRPPLKQSRGLPCILKGSSSLLDTQKAFFDLSDTELEHFNTLKLGKEAISKSLAIGRRAQYIETMKKKFVTNDKSVTDDDTKRMIEEVLDSRSLPPHWTLHLWNGQEFVEIMVESILEDKYKFNDVLCLDPIEPDYDDGRLVGKLFLNQEIPCIYSFAKGGQTYRLLDKEHGIRLEANLHHAVNETLTILGDRKEVFTYGGTLVSPINGKFNYLDRPKMKHHLGGIIHYWGENKPCNPTNELVDGVISIGSAKNINPVKGFIDHPIIDASFKMLNRQGYNAQMQILADFDYADFDVSDRKLNDEEVKQHLQRIYTPFTGFEVASNEDKTVLFAAIFSAVVRQVLTICPAFGIDAPMQGSGKTLLAETIAIIASGTQAAALPPSAAHHDEEFRKRLFAILLKGEKVCIFDNLVGEFDSPSFAAALTSEFYEDRVLGHSRTAKILIKTLFLLTGNNLSFVGDMNRRVLRLRLRPQNDKLAKREFYFNPVAKASAMRFEIISSVLSLINHWVYSGAPKASSKTTSFDEWDTLVRQPLAFIASEYPELGLHDVLDVSLQQQADSSDKEALVSLLRSLAIRFEVNKLFKAGNVFGYLNNRPCFDETLQDAVYAFVDKNKLQSSQHIGNLLKQFIDRNVEGIVLRSKKGSGSMNYWVELTDETHKQAIEKEVEAMRHPTDQAGNLHRLEINANNASP
jgi:hypothetical protein